MKYYEVSAKYVKMDENGKEKKVSEQYLVDAISCSEAESRTIDKLKEMISGEFNVTKIAQSNISEIIEGDSDIADRWFKAKVAFITVDEETGKEKRMCQNVLVYSDTVQNADSEIKTAMSGLMAEFVIVSISESAILEVWPYVEAVPSNLKPVATFRIENEELFSATVIETGQKIDVVRGLFGLWFCVSDPGSKNYKEEELEFEEENGI